jgi:hypothetical protein
MADSTGQALEEPNVRTRAGQFDMTKALTADFRKRDFNAALIADHSAMFHPLVFAAEAFPIGHGTKNTSAEQTVPLRLEGAVIYGFRLGYLTM